MENVAASKAFAFVGVRCPEKVGMVWNDRCEGVLPKTNFINVWGYEKFIFWKDRKKDEMTQR